MGTAAIRRGARAGAGPDRVAVALYALAAFLGVLALLASQISAAPGPRPRPVVVLRRVYETRIVESAVGATHAGTPASQSVSSSTSAPAAAAAPTTRSS